MLCTTSSKITCDILEIQNEGNIHVSRDFFCSKNNVCSEVFFYLVSFTSKFFQLVSMSLTYIKYTYNTKFTCDSLKM